MPSLTDLSSATRALVGGLLGPLMPVHLRIDASAASATDAPRWRRSFARGYRADLSRFGAEHRRIDDDLRAFSVDRLYRIGPGLAFRQLAMTPITSIVAFWSATAWRARASARGSAGGR